MNVSEVLVKFLENDGVKCLFGYPGEQILPFYKAVYDSDIEHILTRHEQGAVHAADGYARASGKYGVAIATAGPGAMNLVMGVATAFKDSVPLLIITGDNEYAEVPDDDFQSFPLIDIFKNITVKSFHPSDSKTAVSDFKEAFSILNSYPKGPVFINLSKDVAIEEVVEDLDFENMDLNIGFDEFKLKFNEIADFNCPNQDNDVGEAIGKLSNAKKPLIVIGNGIVWGDSVELLNELVSKYNIPIVATYHSRGVVSEFDKLNLGMVGIRGNALSDYAYLNSDCIIALGTKLSKRSIAKSPNFEEFSKKVIHVNIDKTCLKGEINLCMDVKDFLNILFDLDVLKDYDDNYSSKWIDEIYDSAELVVYEGTEELEENYNPLRPQYAINKIMTSFEHFHFVCDAGTHTIWTMLLGKPDRFDKFLFSGGFGSMGYSIPAAIGVAMVNPNDKIIVLCGDGDIQMVSQELAAIAQYNFNISIFVINNSELGLIRQWQETLYNFKEHYQIDLANPDFVKLSESYGIKAFKAIDKESLELAIKEALKDGPSLVEVITTKENVPLP